MSMREAVERFVPDGSSVVMGACLEPLIPFAAGHEMIRQRRRDLTLVGPISDGLFDQMIGSGCVRRVAAAWVGNVSEGLGHNYRRAAEHGRPRPLEIHDFSNFSISLALWASAWNVPYLPTVSLLGSDILKSNPQLEEVDGLVHVSGLKPDVAVLHVQRADSSGRAHAWGPLGISEEAGLAAERVILTCEELVPAEVTLSDPNRILLPETKVVAVVHEPGGAHPSPVQGYWRRDHDFFRSYARDSRSADGFKAWLEEWVLGVPNRKSYLAKLDLDAIRITRQRLSVPVDYGDE